ncbi:MAG: ABC transporter substrate-binding protein [Alphaproteobacteria bacterium]
MIGRSILSLWATAFLLIAHPAIGQISDGVVKIGVMTDLSGPYSDFSGMGSVTAVQIAIEDFGSTVAGVPIEIVSADHQNKSDIAATRARKWIEVEEVDLVTDLSNSAVALAVQEVGRDTDHLIAVTGAVTTRLTNENCSPVGIHWANDTHALAVGTAKAVLEEGGDSWFIIAADYAFGHSLEADVRRVVEANGGTVLGAIRHPFPTADFSSYLLQAQASGAKVIALANAGQDATNSVKQAHEFGITEMGQQLVGLAMYISDVHALGLGTAHGLLMTTGFYWDYGDEARAWSERFFERTGVRPTTIHAANYSATTHYLRAVEAAGSDEARAVVAKMKELPIEDFFARNGYLRDDGRMVHDMYLARVKEPEESTNPWDLYEIARVIPGEEAFQPLSESTCPLVQ